MIATDPVLDQGDPLSIARHFTQSQFHHPQHAALIYVDGEFYRFNGVCWEAVEADAIRQQLYHWLEPRKAIVRGNEREWTEPFKPTKRKVDLVVDALHAATYKPVRSPQWITGTAAADPARLIVATNGIFELVDGTAKKVSAPTPLLFATNALDYALQVDTPPPLRWIQFLIDIFDDDQQQIDLFQEWCGYILTLDTSLQKMLLLVGPPRSGKGTAARILARVVGLANVAAPTLAGMGTQFGLWPLVGKSLAIISDARLSGRTDQAVVTERLLSITGEDLQTIDIKNRKPITVKLPTRLMILTNELPKLSDSSGALANRFVILNLKKSYLGAEDTGLTDRLLPEVPGIAAWALKGLVRLRDEGRFTTPAAGDDLRAEMNDLASPVTAFVRDYCIVRPGLQIKTAELFDGWQAWSHEQGSRHTGTVQTFGRDLRAAYPRIERKNPRDEFGGRPWTYIGIDLTASGREMAAKYRAVSNGTSTFGVDA